MSWESGKLIMNRMMLKYQRASFLLIYVTFAVTAMNNAEWWTTVVFLAIGVGLSVWIERDAEDDK